MRFLLLIPLLSTTAFSQVRPLAQEHQVLWESPVPKALYGYTPGICRMPSGRLVVTHEISSSGDPVTFPDGKKVPFFHEGRVLTSDDEGTTWTQRATFDFSFARPFAVGDTLYLLGRSKQVCIARSDDGGATWTEPVRLRDKGIWHQSACNVWFANDCVYLVMEKHAPLRGISGWQVGDLMPILMRAQLDSDLLDPASWSYASERVFEDIWKPQYGNGMGIPFYPVGPDDPTFLVPPKGRGFSPIGWLETNVVQFTDSDHIWHDPEGKTFYLWMRAHTGLTNLAAIAKVTENPKGEMTTSLVEAPSGQTMLYAPCPGGQMRFHVTWDEETQLFWLLSSQSTDSMTRPDRLAKDRWGTPDNERQRLTLHFSKNMIDWCFAGLVAKGGSPKESRHYAAMCIDGSDLCIVSRSGDERAHSAHNGNLITFHRVKDFRKLVY